MQAQPAANLCQLGRILLTVRVEQVLDLGRQAGEQFGQLRCQVDALALKLDAEFEGEPVDARRLADVGPPADFSSARR